MRSADLSGAGANGFGAGKGKADNRHARGQRPAQHRARLDISPITAAVALTALLSATLFIIYDASRTFYETRRELAVIGSALASEIADLAPEAAEAAVVASSARFATLAHASLITTSTTPLQTDLMSQLVPAGPHGVLTLEPTAMLSWLGVAQRGGGALALAGLLIMISWRRNRYETPNAIRRQNYSTLASAIPMGVACWTQTGDLVVCNERYTDSLQLGGASTSYHDAVRRLIVGGYMKLLREDETTRLLELHREDGSCLLIDERPLSDGGFMTLVSDITEEKKTNSLLTAIREEQRLLARRYHEEKLKAEAASRSKTNFLAHLSHDIRTPLNHIIGFAELMGHQTYGPLGDARYDDYVQSIKTSGEHLLESFATILDLAELDSGQKTLRNDPVDIDHLIEGTVERFRAQAARRGLTIVVGQSCGAIVSGDPLGLTRMVTNIVENSLRFTPKGGRITLAGFAAHDGVVIEVTDNGFGMTEDRLASLSQPFALGDATFTREGIGPGLGISISRAIAELSGGHMAIDSSPSLGTTVAFSLPLRLENALVAAE